jgi:hypothetical protein
MFISSLKCVSRLGITLLALLSFSAFTRAQWTKVNNIPASTGPSTCLLLTDGTVICQATEGGKSWLRLTPDNTGNYENGTWTSLTDAAPTTASSVPRGYRRQLQLDGAWAITGTPRWNRHPILRQSCRKQRRRVPWSTTHQSYDVNRPAERE